MFRIPVYIKKLSEPVVLKALAAMAVICGVYSVVTAYQASVSGVVIILSGALCCISGCVIWVMSGRLKQLQVKAVELRASEERLRQLGHFRQQFFSNMSHEFRTPLNAIQGFSQAVLHRQNDMSDAQIADYVKLIEKSARELGVLTDDVLDLSKLDAQKFELDLQDFDLSRLIRSVIIRHATQASDHDIILTCDIEEDWIILADPRAIRRCLDCLISNALKFSPDGKEIRINVFRCGHSTFMIGIKDHGPGIPKTELETIWTSYARCTLAKDTGKVGAGLGLAMTRSLVEAHNGFIKIDSEEGAGTCVRLCFPVQMIVHRRNPARDEPQALSLTG